MDIVVGSQNKTKITAVKHVFPDAAIYPKHVPSDVSEQPIGDEETRLGAINRANHAQSSKPGSIGIGLEGGVMYVAEQLYLCNWGALQTSDGTIFTAAGARITLPEMFKEKIDKGMELSDMMDAYTKQTDIRNHEGAIGIFTSNLIDRSALFVHVATLLRGQFMYAQ